MSLGQAFFPHAGTTERHFQDKANLLLQDNLPLTCHWLSVLQSPRHGPDNQCRFGGIHWNHTLTRSPVCSAYFLFIKASLPSCMNAKLLQSCPILCDPMDRSLPESVHGSLQVRILERIVMPSSRGVFPTQGSNLCFLHILHWQRALYHRRHMGSLIHMFHFYLIPNPLGKLIFLKKTFTYLAALGISCSFGIF